MGQLVSEQVRKCSLRCAQNILRVNILEHLVEIM